MKRRAIRRKPGVKPTEYIVPQKSKKPFGSTKDYKYFWGHVVKEIAKKLPKDEVVICWHTDHMLSLPICAVKKFVQEQQYCKRCPLFQNDTHAEKLRIIVEEWEKDDLEEPNAG